MRVLDTWKDSLVHMRILDLERMCDIDLTTPRSNCMAYSFDYKADHDWYPFAIRSGQSEFQMKNERLLHI